MSGTFIYKKGQIQKNKLKSAFYTDLSRIIGIIFSADKMNGFFNDFQYLCSNKKLDKFILAMQCNYFRRVVKFNLGE
jgi:hypothetical protein